MQDIRNERQFQNVHQDIHDGSPGDFFRTIEEATAYLDKQAAVIFDEIL